MEGSEDPMLTVEKSRNMLLHQKTPSSIFNDPLMSAFGGMSEKNMDNPSPMIAHSNKIMQTLEIKGLSTQRLVTGGSKSPLPGSHLPQHPSLTTKKGVLP